MGLALEVLEPCALMPRAQAIAQSFGGASALAMRFSKQALQQSLQTDLATMLDLEVDGQAQAGASAYAQEAVRRFGARQPAQFAWPPPIQPSSNPSCP